MQTTIGAQPRDVLTREDATMRSGRVRDIRYDVRLDLDADADAFAGHVIVDFESLGAADPSDPLFLDFSGRIEMMAIDGADIAPDHRGHRLILPTGLASGRHRVEVRYRNRYDRTGDGVHRFVDPEDGAEYVYTHFEPFSAHRLLPCFDQPDLKATFALRVEAPGAWRVISAGSANAVETLPDGRRRHDFATTPPISTYVFSIVAGEWERVEDGRAEVPLALFGRRSMRRELERSADEIFEVTAAGMGYFGELFGRPFPFSKYDQLFVPEFNFGAMENVGAVVFHDQFLFRDPPTYAQRSFRAEVVAHELAHMWFGNLVTTRWWDDLWLNETFATYVSYRCLADATRFTDAWRSFDGQLRQAAYRQDQLSTTHPVAADVRDTDEAAGNFDAITYEKGATVIRQLVATLGEDVFRAGMRRYVDEHAWANATLDDFLAALGSAAGRPLDEWARVWLREPSLDTIGLEVTTAGGRVTSLEAWQTAPPAHPTLRPHTSTIAVVEEGTDGGLRVGRLPLSIDAERAHVAGASGRPAPVFLYPDLDGDDYALVRLDPASLAFARERLPEIVDPFLRQHIWSTAWQMVRDALLPAPAFLAMVVRFVPLETDRPIIDAVTGWAATALARYLPAELEERERAAFMAMALRCLEAADEPELRLMWARTAIATAADAESVERMAELVDAGPSRRAFAADQEMRWTIAAKAIAHGLAGAEERLAAEVARDRSDRGVRAAIGVEAGRPEPEAKRVTWERIHGEGYGSDYLTRAAIRGFVWRHQRTVLEPFREPWFENARRIYREREHAFAKRYVADLAPDRWGEAAMAERIRREAGGLGDDELLLRRQLTEIADELGRTISVRAAAASGS